MADTTVAYKCPNCNAPLSFQPGHDKVTCEYCGTEFEIETIKTMFDKEQERAAKAAEAEQAARPRTSRSSPARPAAPSSSATRTPSLQSAATAATRR